MNGKRLEEFPSLWWLEAWGVLVAAYVDDVITAGPLGGVDMFWAKVQQFKTFDEITTPGRYLGSDHLIVEFNHGRKVVMRMADYALSAVDMYEAEFGVIKDQETPFTSESALTSEGFNERGQIAGSAASLLMKLLWLARLSRPDLSFCIVSLAGAITRWSRLHDLQLKRLIGYVKRTHDLGLCGEKYLSQKSHLLCTFTAIRIWQGIILSARAIQEYVYV